MDDVSKQVARLSISIMDEGSALKRAGPVSSCSPFGESWNRRICLEESENMLVEKAKDNTIDPEQLIDLEGSHVIILSDDEKEPEVSICLEPSGGFSEQSMDVYGHAETSEAGRTYKADLQEKDFSTSEHLKVSPDASYNDVNEKMSTDTIEGKLTSQLTVQEEQSESKVKETKAGINKDNLDLAKTSDVSVSSKQFDSFTSQLNASNSTLADLSMTSASNVQLGVVTSLRNRGDSGMVCDTDDDAWKFSFFKPPKRQQPLISKQSSSGPKRQVIQLALPEKNRPGSMKLGGGVKRFQPPRLDNWYRPILELDFFSAVGIVPGINKGNQNVGKLKEVPVYFQSPDEYVEIFRSLVLEEFKAQMLSSYQEIASAEEMFCGRLSVLSVERIDDFHFVRFVHDENESTGSKNLLENDLVLITRQPIPNSVGDVHSVGKVCSSPFEYYYLVL